MSGLWLPRSLEKTAKDLAIEVSDLIELRAKLEAGHIVQWQEGPNFFMCQKRGEEYVTIMAHSEKKLRADWKTLNRKGHAYDGKTGRRVTVPGCR